MVQVKRKTVLVPGLLALLVSGCGVTVQDGASGANATVAGMSGSVHGGQQPIAGATVRVMMPGLTGYGSAPSVLSTATTDGGGGFSMPAYTCPSNSGLLYMTVTGGNSGSGTNSFSAEAAVLGPCNAQLQASFVRVTEVTTVAAAYALAPFASVFPSGTGVGTTASNTTGLNNTYGVTNLIAPNSTGAAAASPQQPGILVPPISLPQFLLNTVANILASCINTAGSMAAGSTCASLVANTTVNGVAPVDTFQAAINLSRQTSANVSALYSLVAANAPFQPAYSTMPGDFSLLVGYAGLIAFGTPVTAGTGQIAVDSGGDVFTLSATNLVKVAPGGVLTSAPLVSCSAQGLAISSAGNVYVSCNASAGSVQEYSPSGVLLATIQTPDLSYPSALAFDNAGNLWVAANNSLVEYRGSGVEVSSSPYLLSASPTDLAISRPAIWAKVGQSALLRVDYLSHALTNYAQNVNFDSVAVDQSSNVWGASLYQDPYFNNFSSALEVSDSGTTVSPTNGYASNALVASTVGIALDGLGSAYTASSTAHPTGRTAIVLAYSTAGALMANQVMSTSTQTFGSPVSPMTTTPGKPMLDQSGNLWVPGPFGAGGYLTTVIGFGAPVLAPFSTALVANSVAARP